MQLASLCPQNLPQVNVHPPLHSTAKLVQIAPRQLHHPNESTDEITFFSGRDFTLWWRRRRWQTSTPTAQPSPLPQPSFATILGIAPIFLHHHLSAVHLARHEYPSLGGQWQLRARKRRLGRRKLWRASRIPRRRIHYPRTGSLPPLLHFPGHRLLDWKPTLDHAVERSCLRLLPRGAPGAAPKHCQPLPLLRQGPQQLAPGLQPRVRQRHHRMYVPDISIFRSPPSSN